MRSRKAWASFAPSASALRVRQWMHFLPLPFAAIDSTHGTSGLLAPCAGTLVAAGALAYAYGLNGITDRHSDRSSEKNPLRGLAAVPPGAIVAVGACAVSALAIAWIALGRVAQLAVALSLFGATVYSVGIRTKSVPFLGTLTNVVIFAPLLFVGVAGSAPPPIQGLVLAFAGLLLQNQLVHELADLAEDAIANDLSTARVLGRDGVCVATVAVAVITVVSLAMVPVSSPVRVVSCAVLALGAAVPSIVESPARARVIHRFLALLGGSLIFVIAQGAS